MIQEKKLGSFDVFDEMISRELRSRRDRRRLSTASIIFRGQSNAEWDLKSSLDRYLENRPYLKRSWSEREYIQMLHILLPFVKSLSQTHIDLDEYEARKMDMLPPIGYEFMIYLRHHGFPSPLLDWSESPYVAAFFAFEAAVDRDVKEVAIFSFEEYGDLVKSTNLSVPHIRGYGPSVRTHRRHFQQQCYYTVCHQYRGKEKIYCEYKDEVFGKDQDKLIKYILPSSDREVALEKLDRMNINAFTLFGNEDALARTLAFRTIDCSPHFWMHECPE